MVFGIFRKPLPSDATPQETEASVLKEARDRCYKVFLRFYHDLCKA